MLEDFKAFLQTDIQLIFRNNRPQQYFYQVTMIFVCTFILLFIAWQYNLVFKEPLLVYMSVFGTGALLYIFGMFAFSFWSTFFPVFYTNLINWQRIVLYKYLFFISSIFLLTGISVLLAAMISTKLIPFFFIGGLWNISISTMLILFFASHNIDRCGLSKSTLLNFEAWGYMESMFLILTFYLPPSIFLLLKTFIPIDTIVYSDLVLCCIILCFHPLIIRRISNNMNKRKYRILDLFRNGEN
jgi:hypothetical protein